MPNISSRPFATIRFSRAAMGLCLLLALASCSKKGEPTSEAAFTGSEAVPAPAPASPAAASAEKSSVADARQRQQRTEEQLSSSVNTAPNDAGRQFIRTANAAFQVKDVYKSSLAIEDLTASLGGYVELNQITTQELERTGYPVGDGKLRETRRNRVEGELRLRVPSTKTQDLLRGMSNQIEFLEGRIYTAENARLMLLRAQLDALRAQTTANDLDQANRQGGRLNNRVEAIDAKGQALDAFNEATIRRAEFMDKIEFATIELRLTQADMVTTLEIADAAGAMRDGKPGFWIRAWQAVSAGWVVLLDALLVLLSTWPLWVLLLALWRGTRMVRRRWPQAFGGKSVAQKAAPDGQ